MLVFDLYVYVGDFERAAALIDDAMARASTGDADHQRPKTMLKRAWLDLIEGDPARALARLAELEAAADVEQPEDRTGIARVKAQAQLAQGDAAAARATLLAFDDAPTAETWALMLALRLRSGVALGAVTPSDLERARAELNNDRLPRLEHALLAFAVADTLQAQRDARAVAARKEANAARETLAATLAGQPERRRRFLACFPGPA